jgi:SRSO17 transposase
MVGEGERKSVEPIAERATGDDPAECERIQARLLNFLRESPWDDRSVRREAARYVVKALEEQEPVTAWVIDDTGFPKQGKHSVGVQRQYSGTLGKVGNCQIGVSLTVATRHEHVPIDFALYMPESWLDDPVRRAQAKVPEGLVFKTKPDLALDLISRAVDDKLPGDIVLVDAAYGNSSEFRNTVRMYGLDLGVAVQASTKVWTLDKIDRRRGEPIGAQDRAHHQGAMAHGTRLRGTQRRTRARSLRRSFVSRLASSHLGCSLLLRVHRCRTCAAFPPSARRQNNPDTNTFAACAALRRLLHHHPPRDRTDPRALVAAVPVLPSA